MSRHHEQGMEGENEHATINGLSKPMKWMPFQEEQEMFKNEIENQVMSKWQVNVKRLGEAATKN